VLLFALLSEAALSLTLCYVLQVTLYRYDGEEWLNIISRDNQLAAMGWTKEETDYLLDMLEAYDLRFMVVADRYNVRGPSILLPFIDLQRLIPCMLVLLTPCMCCTQPQQFENVSVMKLLILRTDVMRYRCHDCFVESCSS
jgi:hypothetical protein